MRILIKRASAAFLAVLMIISFAACKKLPELKRDADGNYFDSKKSVTYIPAPGCYEPASIGEEYRRIGDNTLKKIGELDPQKWLCDEKYKNVFYASDTELPTFEGMTVTEIKLCYEDVYTVEFVKITDPAEIAEVRDVYLNGESGIGFSVAPEKVISVKFVFEECPGIYYNLSFSLDTSTGEAYLTNRYEHKIVKASGLFSKYFDDAETLGQS